MENFIEKFKEALETEEDIKLTDEFRELGEWDSLSRLSLIAILDEEYDVQIEEAEFENLKTVQDIMDSVKAKMS